jgi:hypothetical protein
MNRDGLAADWLLPFRGFWLMSNRSVTRVVTLSMLTFGSGGLAVLSGEVVYSDIRGQWGLHNRSEVVLQSGDCSRSFIHRSPHSRLLCVPRSYVSVGGWWLDG